MNIDFTPAQATVVRGLVLTAMNGTDELEYLDILDDILEQLPSTDQILLTIKGHQYEWRPVTP